MSVDASGLVLTCSAPVLVWRLSACRKLRTYVLCGTGPFRYASLEYEAEAERKAEGLETVIIGSCPTPDFLVTAVPVIISARAFVASSCGFKTSADIETSESASYVTRSVESGGNCMFQVDANT